MKKYMHPVIFVAAGLIVAGTFSACKGSTPAITKSYGQAQTAAATPTPYIMPAEASKYFDFAPDVYKKFTDYETFVEYITGYSVQIRHKYAGTTDQTVYCYKDGKVIKTYVAKDAAYRQNMTSASDASATGEVVLMEPVRKGTTWTLADGATRTITDEAATLSLPAGIYKAAEVTTVRAGKTEKAYFSPNIGLVKTVLADGHENILISYNPNKSFSQTVRFFFPNAQTEKAVYVDRTVTLKTNEDIMPAFENELKLAPGSGDIAPVFKSGPNIIEMRLDPGSTKAYINLTDGFVSSLNAGAGYEGLVLKSLADTVCNYFAVSEAVLETDSKPYASGHFLFQKGDTIKADIGSAVGYQ